MCRAVSKRYEAIKGHVDGFWYNYRWDDYVGLFSGPVSRLTIFVPVFAYLIIFNDSLVGSVSFTKLSSGCDTTFFLNDTFRLQLVYFGLIYLGTSQVLFRWRQPFVLKQAKTQSDYITFAKNVFTPRDYIEIRSRISQEGHVTLYGNDELDKWDDFLQHLTDKSMTGYSYTHALEKYSGLVRCLAIENFVSNVRLRRFSLSMSLVLLLLGYLCLFVTSVDLFMKVVQVSVVGCQIVST